MNLKRLRAIEVYVSAAEFSRDRAEVGEVCTAFVPSELRLVADWYVAELKPPNDFADAVIIRLVAR